MATLQTESLQTLNKNLDITRRAALPQIRQEILDELHRRAAEEFALVKIMGQPMALSVMHAIYNA